MEPGVNTQLNSTAIDLVKHANKLVNQAKNAQPKEAIVLKNGAALLASQANKLVTSAENVAVANAMATHAQNVAKNGNHNAVVASLNAMGRKAPNGSEAPSMLVNIANKTASQIVPYMSNQQKAYAVVDSVMKATNQVQTQEIISARTSLQSLGKKLGIMSNNSAMQNAGQGVLRSASAFTNNYSPVPNTPPKNLPGKTRNTGPVRPNNSNKETGNMTYIQGGLRKIYANSNGKKYTRANGVLGPVRNNLYGGMQGLFSNRMM